MRLQVVAFVQPDDYSQLISKLVEWQESTTKQDELFAEIKPLLWV